MATTKKMAMKTKRAVDVISSSEYFVFFIFLNYVSLVPPYTIYIYYIYILFFLLL